jgi:anti-sigma factor RsiW
MSTIDERLEILIGKFIDGEISPAERRVLEDELSRNRRGRALLEQLQALRDSSREVVASEILGQGGESEDIFERAWQRHERTRWHRIVKVRADGHLRFAVGLAAGFLLGLVLHFVLVWTGAGPDEPAGRPPVARDINPEPEPTLATTRDSLRPVIRNVDWYGFTDDAGNQWLVEGVREGMIRPAAYHGDVR